MSAIGEKHGWLLADKHYLGGLVTVKAWGWWTGYTAAQIELMVADSPLVTYGDGKKKVNRGDVEKAHRDWMGLDERETRNVKLSELLKG